MAKQYLIRTIPRHESRKWVEALNDDPTMFVPLSVEPREEFDGIVVLHNGGAYVFDVDCIEQGDGNQVMCGENEDQPVEAVVNIFVKLGSMQRFVSLKPGFMGIRYATRLSLSSWLAKPMIFYTQDSCGKGFWTHLEQFLGAVRPGQTLITTLDALHLFIVSAGFDFPAWSMDIALDYLPDEFPFVVKRTNTNLHFTRR